MLAFDDSSASKHIDSTPEALGSGAKRPLHHVLEKRIIDTVSKAAITSRRKNRDDGPLRVTLSVGGMTCASCSGTITTMLLDVQGVSEATVSLLGKSASVIVDHTELVEVVVEMVKDCGFEAEVVSVESLGALDDETTTDLRTIALRIEGMFCR